MNKAFLVGRLTRDPELRYTTTNNNAVVNFSIAINRTYNSEETDFINIEAWNKQAENANKYLKKGSQVAVDGSIRIDNYTDKEGNKRQALKVVANSIQFLSTKAETEALAKENSDDVSPADFADDNGEDAYEDFGNNIEIDEISDETFDFM